MIGFAGTFVYLEQYGNGRKGVSRVDGGSIWGGSVGMNERACACVEVVLFQTSSSFPFFFHHPLLNDAISLFPSQSPFMDPGRNVLDM